jgi:hypothetical protein
MRKLKLFSLSSVLLCMALAGCSSHGVTSSLGAGGSGVSGTPTPLLITDTPPAGVTVLSFEVTLSSVKLEPGNVALLSTPTVAEITRLQTETDDLSNVSVATGSYTSLSVTYSNPTLTFENNTTATITVGGTACTAGSTCTVSPTAVNESATLTFPSALVVSATAPQAVQVDLNLTNLFSSTLGADFNAGSSVSVVTPPSQGEALDAVEDFVGTIQSESTANSTITIANSLGLLTATVNSNTTFNDFPSSTCPTPKFSCLATGQILSADLSVQSNGTLVAENFWFKDATSAATEVEGVITGVNVPSQQFTYVVLNESAAISGLTVGNVATVHWNVAPTTTTFAPDDMGINTTGYLFSNPADLMVGQEVSVLRDTTSSGLSLNADRVLLRASRLTATVTGPVAFPNLTIGDLASFFGAAGTAQIVVTVSTIGDTEYGGNANVFTEIPVNGSVSVRGQLFPNAGTPTILASRIVLN